MAAVKTLNGEKLLIKIGDGGGPEIFAHPCLINTDRGITLSSDVTEILVPDCDFPDLPGWKQRLKDGMSAEISGAGRLHTPDLEVFFNWVTTDTTKNVRVETSGVIGTNGGGYIAGAFKCTSLNVTGPRKNLTDVELTLMSHGPCTWTDLP